MLIEDKKINEENIKTFKRYDIYESGEKRHTCVLCGAKVNIDNSASNQGDRLICMNCYYTKFDDWTKARKWIQREDK